MSGEAKVVDVQRSYFGMRQGGAEANVGA